MNSFHFRSPLPQSEIVSGERRARRQEDEILDFMQFASNVCMTAEDIQYRYPNYPITSIRRALTNLHNAGRIIEEGKRVGQYGVSITKYRYCQPSDVQMELQFAKDEKLELQFPKDEQLFLPVTAPVYTEYTEVI